MVLAKAHLFFLSIIFENTDGLKSWLNWKKHKIHEVIFMSLKQQLMVHQMWNLGTPGFIFGSSIPAPNWISWTKVQSQIFWYRKSQISAKVEFTGVLWTHDYLFSVITKPFYAEVVCLVLSNLCSCQALRLSSSTFLITSINLLININLGKKQSWVWIKNQFGQ